MASHIRLFDLTTSVVSPFPFGSSPPYLAISHVWSESLFPSTIDNVDGSPGLAAARAVISEQFPDVRFLWFDTLCIDQSDEGDKYAQIPHMGRIYEDSVAVAIVLGTRLDIEQVDITRLSLIFRPAWERFRSIIRDLDKERDFWTRQEGREYLLRGQQVLAPIWRLKWIRRVWTLQEYILAPSVIWVGSDFAMLHIPEYLPIIVGYLSSFYIPSAPLFQELQMTISRHLETSEARIDRANGLRKTYMSMVTLGEFCEATESVDKIYGMMAASGLVIAPIRGESKEEAWARWWAEALRNGNVMWMMTPSGVVPSSGYDGADGIKRNCVMPSFSERARAQRSTQTISENRSDRIAVGADGTVKTKGRLVGHCETVREISRSHLDDSFINLSYNRDLRICLFSKGDAALAHDVAVALANAAGTFEISMRHVDNLAALLMNNYETAHNQVLTRSNEPFEWVVQSDDQAAALRLLRGIADWHTYNMAESSVVYLAEVVLPTLGSSTKVLLAGNEWSAPEKLLFLDFNAKIYEGQRLLMAVDSTDGGGNGILHKFGVAILSLPETSDWEKMPLQEFSIGGASCSGCSRRRAGLREAAGLEKKTQFNSITISDDGKPHLSQSTTRGFDAIVLKLQRFLRKGRLVSSKRKEQNI